jgi:hypothetical protein
MIIAGDAPFFWPAEKTEVVDLTTGVTTCSDLADFYYPKEGAIGANLAGTPVVCGGSHKSCHRFTNNGWKKFASMKEKRQYGAGVIYNKKLIVFGGFSKSWNYLKSSEIINVDSGVSDGPDMPSAVAQHAMTSINGTVFILSGGRKEFTKGQLISECLRFFQIFKKKQLKT